MRSARAMSRPSFHARWMETILVGDRHDADATLRAAGTLGSASAGSIVWTSTPP